jgi:hypothetical protein
MNLDQSADDWYFYLPPSYATDGFTQNSHLIFNDDGTATTDVWLESWM